ncbi:hypothetical protein KEM48_008965 [Puccinia striiformis f. sp. tritici PST-130]|uniref:Uncharacterized protein n=1 Tax=Puccinia striiformis f. sp. tritici PST-78 TaxID=1165861 RepID=A0A0L0UV12_9BASI|nr:hypothetical protein KEM48_008965 [Puccinia striiformis f. sp. tritici PST-130]KNE90860.1 hypothetical protein PSTG_15700 [Puccinia striiformis f. sp. tritici PST-78]
MLAERAAERLYISAQKKATRARETQQRAAGKAEEKARASKAEKRSKKACGDEEEAGSILSHAEGVDTQDKDTLSKWENSTIKLVKVGKSAGGRVHTAGEVNEEENLPTRGKKRAQANADRAARERDEANAKRIRREAMVNKKVGALAKQMSRQREHVNKVLRQGQTVAAMEEIRTELGNHSSSPPELSSLKTCGVSCSERS